MRFFVYYFGMSSSPRKPSSKTRPQTPPAPIGENFRAMGDYAVSLLQLIEGLPDIAFFVKNRESRFVYANARFVRIMGAARLEDLMGRTDFDFSPRDLAEAFVRDDRAVMRTGRPIVNKVELVPNEDGVVRWHVTSKVPIRDARGVIRGLAGYTRDLQRAGATIRRYRELSPVTDYIERHLGEPIRARDLAAVANLSVSQFERRFRRTFHMTPRQYVTRARISAACRMLSKSEAKLTEIALACGFYDHSHFSRYFVRAVGISPGAFRRQTET